MTPLAGLWLNPRNDQSMEQPVSALTGGCGFLEKSGRKSQGFKSVFMGVGHEAYAILVMSLRFACEVNLEWF